MVLLRPGPMRNRRSHTAVIAGFRPLPPGSERRGLAQIGEGKALQLQDILGLAIVVKRIGSWSEWSMLNLNMRVLILECTVYLSSFCTNDVIG